MALHGTDAKGEAGSTRYVPEQDSASSRSRLEPPCSGSLMALHGTDAKGEAGSTRYVPEQDSASSRSRLEPPCSGSLMALHGTDAKAESGSTLYIPEQDSASSRSRLEPPCSGSLMALHGTDAKAESGSTLYIPEQDSASSRNRLEPSRSNWRLCGRRCRRAHFFSEGPFPLRLPQARLDQVLDRFREVEARMGAASEAGEIVRLAKEHAELKPVAEAAERLASARAERADLEAMVSGSDPEMAELAREELDALSGRIGEIEHDLALLLGPRDADENASGVLEVAAGTG